MSRFVIVLLALVACAAARAAAEEPGPVGQSAEAVADAADDGATDGEPPEPEAPSPRARYNAALERLAAGELELAATELLGARDEAGPDPELRYRAAFNLGIALAGQADAVEQESPEEAIEKLRGSAAWFNDAIRLAPESDEDARINLELVLRRIQQLADQLNEGNRLEARLDRIIDDQRGLRDRIRRLLATVESEGAAAEPVGFQREFDELATFERTLLAEAGSIGDLAAEERALIEEKGDDQRTQEERARAFQLESLDQYLQQARQSLSDARRRLRRLDAERAHRRADAALAELKRAREQLVDPITVLKAVARDEASLLAHTKALAALSGGGLRLAESEAEIAPPAWLTREHLGERQADVAARTGEVRARLEAGTSAETQEVQQADARMQRVLQSAREALPHLGAALAAMQDTRSALSTGQLSAAAESELEALESLQRAIERFAGVRELIELAFADQTRIVELVTPPGEAAPETELSTEERSGLVGAAAAANLDRLERLEGLLDEDRLAAEGAAEQGEGGASADPAQLESVRERYARAEALRADAHTALERLDAELVRLDSDTGAANLLEPAQEALGQLEELRRLFFSLIEHLRELLAEQADTHDRTATLQFESSIDQLVPELGLVSERQIRHAATGDALAGALVRQADAAGAGDEPAGQRASGDLAGAAAEVRTASGLMQGAGALMADATQRAASMSPDLEPALGDQLVAMEHLENAIRLLQPPQQGEDDDQQQQQQQQQQAQQPEQDERMSQRQALRRLQAIRDREAERQRQREREPVQPDPVEKDW